MFANAIFKTIFRKPLILFRFNTLLVESSEFRVNIPRVTTEADKPLDKSPSTETPKEIPIEKETTIDESSNVVEKSKKLVEPAIETLEIVAEPIKPAEKVLKPEEEEIFPDEENLAPVEEEIEESLEAANEILEITPHPEPPAPSIALKSELNDGIAIKNKRKKLKKSNKTDTTKGDVMMTPKKTQVPPDSENGASPEGASKSPNQYTAWTTVTRSKKSPKSVSSQNASPSKNSLSPPDWVRTQQNLTFQWNQFIKGKQTLASNNRSAPTTPKSRPSRPSISTARPTFLSPPNIAKQIMESPIRAPKTTFNDFVTGLTKARPAAANARKSPPTPQPNLFERNVQSFVRSANVSQNLPLVENVQPNNVEPSKVVIPRTEVTPPKKCQKEKSPEVKEPLNIEFFMDPYSDSSVSSSDEDAAALNGETDFAGANECMNQQPATIYESSSPALDSNPIILNINVDSNNNSQDFACLVAPPGIVTNDEFIPDDSWYYMDAHNQVQGPFKNVMMIQWYTAGYFKSDLVLWRACDKRRLTFAELMVLSEGLPFVRKDPLPPITEPLLTSNSIVRAKLELSELEQFIKLKEMQKQKQNAADLEWPQDQLADLEVTAAGLPVNGFRIAHTNPFLEAILKDYEVEYNSSNEISVRASQSYTRSVSASSEFFTPCSSNISGCSSPLNNVFDKIPGFDPSKPPPNWNPEWTCKYCYSRNVTNAIDCSFCKRPKVCLSPIEKKMPPKFVNPVVKPTLMPLAKPILKPMVKSLWDPMEKMWTGAKAVSTPSFEEIQLAEMKKRKAEMREEMKAQQLGQQSVVPVSNEVEKDKTEIEQEIHENFFRANSIQEKKTNLFQSISAYKQQELLNKEYMEALQQASSPGKKDEWKTVSSKKSVKKVEVPAASVPVPIVKSKKAIKQTKKPKDLQAIRIKLEQEFDNWTRHVLVKVNASIDVPEFIRFLKICENSNDVKGYINVYLKAGTWACDYFTKEYMKKRSQYFEELRKLKAHNDDLCDATPANIPSAETYIDRTR